MKIHFTFNKISLPQWRKRFINWSIANNKQSFIYLSLFNTILSVMVFFGHWNVWFVRITHDKIRDEFFNCWLGSIINKKSYIAVCKIVGSLFLVSSNSKNTLSGLMTFYLFNHAGNTSFFNRLSCLLRITPARTNEATNELTSPMTAEATKNPPFQGSLLWTKALSLGVLLRACE